MVESKENIPLDQDFKLSDRIDIDSENCSYKSGLRHRECNSAEKRKWSQISAHKLLLQFASNGTDSCSSDDEIKELCSQQSSPVFSSSPPNKVTRVAVLSKHSAFSARVRPSDGHMRKKHRLTEEDCVSRPSLNFEKMQQVCQRIKFYLYISYFFMYLYLYRIDQDWWNKFKILFSEKEHVPSCMWYFTIVCQTQALFELVWCTFVDYEPKMFKHSELGIFSG